MQREYVTGFLFDDHEELVVLVRKNRPEWQAGKFNGVGGKLEPGETPAEAMRREFREEAGVDVQEWTHFITIFGKDFKVHFFYAHTPLITQVKTMTDEMIMVYPVNAIGQDYDEVVCNLRWLVPMAKSFAAKYEFADHFELEYKTL